MQNIHIQRYLTMSFMTPMHWRWITIAWKPFQIVFVFFFKDWMTSARVFWCHSRTWVPNFFGPWIALRIWWKLWSFVAENNTYMHTFCIKFIKLLLIHGSQVKKCSTRIFPMENFLGFSFIFPSFFPSSIYLSFFLREGWSVMFGDGRRW